MLGKWKERLLIYFYNKQVWSQYKHALNLFDERKTRIINIYRTFTPIGMSARNKFIQQLKIIKHAFTKNTVLRGDFNHDYTKKFDQNYMNCVLFEDF